LLSKKLKEKMKGDLRGYFNAQPKKTNLVPSNQPVFLYKRYYKIGSTIQ